VIGTVPSGHPAAHPQGARDALARGPTGLPEACRAAVRGVAQHRPDPRALPARVWLARRHALIIELAGQGSDAQARHRVALIDVPYHTRFSLNHRVRGGSLISLADVAIAIRGAAQHADLPRAGAVPLPTPRALEDLCPFVLGDMP
jgi:hypothetical protein